MPKVVVVSNFEDWEALYIDGDLKYSGHHIQWPEVLRDYFQVEVEVREVPTYAAYDSTLEPETDGEYAAKTYEEVYFPEKLGA